MIDLASLESQLRKLEIEVGTPAETPEHQIQIVKHRVAIDFGRAYISSCRAISASPNRTAELTSGLVQLPRGKYQAIAADVPWPYRLRVNDATHRNRIPYKPMSLDEIRDLPIPELADPSGCCLWFWYTNNHAPEAMDLIRHWGFEIKTIGTWVKTTKAGAPRIGVGHWLRNSTEHFAVCVRGKLSSFSHTKTLHGDTPAQSVIQAERREHSRKPEQFYQMVERLQPNAQKLDLFTRESREGWTPWGDQSELFNFPSQAL